MALLPKGILALRNVASQEPTRYAMHGVRFKRLEDGKLQAVATDGKRLALVVFDDENREQFPETGIKHATSVPGFTTILPNDALKNAERSMPKGKANARLMGLALDETTANGTVELATIHAPGSVTRTTVPSVEGQFPPVEDVIPGADKPYGTVRIGVNVGLLHELVVALRAATGANGDPVAVLEINDANSAMRVLVASGGQKALGLLAPVEIRDEIPATRATGLLMPVNFATNDAA